MAEKPFKVGLLGLGFMGRRHLDAYRSLSGVEVLTRTSARFAHLQDPDALYEAMIGDPELDALDICLPTALHAPLTIAALDAPAKSLLARASEGGALTARGWTRTLRLSRTIADLEGVAAIRRIHVAEALIYRRPPMGAEGARWSTLRGRTQMTA